MTKVGNQGRRDCSPWCVSHQKHSFVLCQRTNEITRRKRRLERHRQPRNQLRPPRVIFHRLPGSIFNAYRHPCTSLGSSRKSVYQMNALRRQVRDEGNCVRATGGGKEACDRVRKCRVCLLSPGRDHVKAARLPTETSYRVEPAKGVSVPRVRPR
jgi:hypothetical protein